MVNNQDLYAPKGGSSHEGSKPRSHETILIVDDDDYCRKMVYEILSTQGYHLLMASHGEEALKICEQKKIDLLFTDVVMPKLDGVSLAEKLQKFMPELKVIFTSGYSVDRARQRMGSDIHFIEKPYQTIELIQKVDQVLHPRSNKSMT